MAQVLTVASILAVVGLLGWRYADRRFDRRHHAASPAGPDQVREPQQRATLQGVGAGFPAAQPNLVRFLIIGLGFFMLMWVIAAG